jgi:hypothetical protein
LPDPCYYYVFVFRKWLRNQVTADRQMGYTQIGGPASDPSFYFLSFVTSIVNL